MIFIILTLIATLSADPYCNWREQAILKYLKSQIGVVFVFEGKEIKAQNQYREELKKIASRYIKRKRVDELTRRRISKMLKETETEPNTPHDFYERIKGLIGLEQEIERISKEGE